MFVSHAIGATVTLTATFKNSAGNPTDPTGVSLEVTAPDGSASTYTYAAAQVTKASTGVYTRPVVLTTAGAWHYRWEATGAVEAVFTGFLVADDEPTTVVGPYVYTDVPAVVRRAGALLDDLSDTSVPTMEAVREFIIETAGEVNTYLAGKGLPLPVTNPDALRMLAGLNGDGAMIRALEARYATAAGTVDSEPLGILTSARARWDAAITAFLAGTHPLFGLLAGPSDTTAGTAASSLWTNEPAYIPEVDLTNNLGSEVYKGMTL